MKKLVAVAPDRVELVEVDMPKVGEDDVLVRGVRSLLSPGSELKRVRRAEGYGRGTWPNHDLGYAMAGIVEEVGSAVQGIAPGDRVITMGHHQQFVLASGLLTGRRPAIPLPGEVGWDDAPFGCWGRSCINWMRRAGIRHDESVAVVGCGLVGLLMVMWSRLSSPRRVIAIDLSERRLELAKRAGADAVLNPGAGNVVEGVRALTGGGSDVTIHCVGGPAVRAFETSQLVTRNGGRVVLVGHHSSELSILPHQFTGKDLLGASVGFDSGSQLFVDGLQLLQAGKLPVAEIVTHKEPYTGAPAIYDMLIEDPEDAGAILLDWDV
jgi:threonine dehydrogenase-like Zn-dependent dehydrogenase